jgi:hypothetical protein
MKQKSKQWLKKGLPGPIKGQVPATRTKQMELTCYCDKVLIYPNFVPGVTMANDNCILEALGKFMKIFK